jgi:hypothetical protein
MLGDLVTLDEAVEISGQARARFLEQLVGAQQLVEIFADRLALAVLGLEVDSRRPKAADDRFLVEALVAGLQRSRIGAGGLPPETSGVEPGGAPAVEEPAPIPGALI